MYFHLCHGGAAVSPLYEKAVGSNLSLSTSLQLPPTVCRHECEVNW